MIQKMNDALASRSVYDLRTLVRKHLYHNNAESTNEVHYEVRVLYFKCYLYFSLPFSFQFQNIHQSKMYIYKIHMKDNIDEWDGMY